VSCFEHGFSWNLPRITFGRSIGTLLAVILILGVIVKVRILTSLGSAFLPELRQVLAGLEENLDQVVEHRFVLVIDKGGGETLVADASSATWNLLVAEARRRGEAHTNAMNILIHAVVLDVWAVVVDHVHDIADVKTSSRDAGGDHNG
jgi:hypothetical protein